MTTFAEKVLKFNSELNFPGKLPEGIMVMNPFRENNEVPEICDIFYRKFYNDYESRKLILGINPGRFGAGVTGIPFTDTKRLAQVCGIEAASVHTHEPSSVFIYEMIDRYGGAAPFYHDYYIGALSPLGFIRKNEKGNWINCNYYDYPELYTAVKRFMVDSLKKQIDFGLDTTTCYVLGRKNSVYVKQIDEKEKLFTNIVTLDHPRFIVQYRLKQKDRYLNEYLNVLK